MQEHLDTLVQLYQRSCEQHSENPALGTRRENSWHWTTYRQLQEQIDHFRGGLASLGIAKGDHVAIIAHNRLEWVVACFATYGLLASFVPMYEEQLPKNWRFILTDSGAKVVFTATRAIFQQVLEMQLPGLQVFGLDLPNDDPRSFSALMQAGAKHAVDVQQPDAENVANLVYTSGTTGNPKGVILTHGNIATNIKSTAAVFPLDEEDRTLGFLPWAHSYGQAELFYVLLQGASLAINDTILRLLDNLAEVRPTMLVAVPRIFNRIYEVVHLQMSTKPAFFRRLFEAAIRNAIRRLHGERLNAFERLQFALVDRLIFSRIRQRFGGRLKFVLSASAALSKAVAEFVEALGLNVYEGYGLSETSPVVSANTSLHRRLGSVGKIIPDVHVKIDSAASDIPGRGEIIVYGPNVMHGYHNLPELNSEVFTPDGGLRTGDLGYLDEDGFLFITGRIKEQYKLETGKYVMPAPIEEEIKLSPLVSNVMVYGANRPFNVALVVPDTGAVKRWADKNKLRIEDPTSDPRVLTQILHEIKKHSKGFKPYEVPKKVILLSEDFTTENDMLTPTLKLKRRVVERKFAELLEAFYRESIPAEAAPP